MSAVIMVFVGALFFALIGTPAARRIAFKLDLIDIPRSDRAHKEPTAMMGGVAIYLGATIALLLGGVGAWLFLSSWKNLNELAGILSNDHGRNRPLGRPYAA
jgi:UDP-N-acetylmuramyl pentapeptide phosphotransferase/UDP-N-acetylglucosamine-1-phosphate transferase